VADILFRCPDDDFVALLQDTDLEMANLIAARIQESIKQNPFAAGTDQLALQVKVTALSAAAEGQSFAERIAAARVQVHELTVH
jgi:GGDEF domain-containing protein